MSKNVLPKKGCRSSAIGLKHNYEYPYESRYEYKYKYEYHITRIFIPISYSAPLIFPFIADFSTSHEYQLLTSPTRILAPYLTHIKISSLHCLDRKGLLNQSSISRTPTDLSRLERCRSVPSSSWVLVWLA